MNKITSYYDPGKRYKSLRIIGALFTLIGSVLVAIGTLVLAFGLYTLLAPTTGGLLPETRMFAARELGNASLGANFVGILCVAWSFGFLIPGLQLVAVGALFRLLIHLEENTRATALSLDNIRMKLEPKGEDVEPMFRS